MFYYDTQFSETEKREQKTYRDNNLVIERQQVTDRILESIPGEVLREAVSPREAVHFSYRVEEQSISEDALKEIREQVRHNEQMTTRLNEEVKTIASTTERQINRMTNEVVNVNDTSEIAENVTRRMEARQINEIAEKVYSRIERQLANERRRRGL